MWMDSYLKKVSFFLLKKVEVDALLESYYFDIMHGLLLYYFLTTVDNVLGSYPVTIIAKFLMKPSLKCLISQQSQSCPLNTRLKN